MTWLARLFRRPSPGRSSVRGDPERTREVQAVLDELRGTFAADGGDVRLAFVEGGVVGLELHGACAGCAASSLTVELAIRPKLAERCPWFVRIVRA